MNILDYQDGMMYEIFIRRAFKYRNGDRRIGHWSNSLGKLIKKVESAIDKFISRKLENNDKKSLDVLKSKLINTYSKESLKEVIREALEITRKYKE